MSQPPFAGSVSAQATHPDRPLTPAERAHLGLPPTDESTDEGEQ